MCLLKGSQVCILLLSGPMSSKGEEMMAKEKKEKEKKRKNKKEKNMDKDKERAKERSRSPVRVAASASSALAAPSALSPERPARTATPAEAPMVAASPRLPSDGSLWEQGQLLSPELLSLVMKEKEVLKQQGVSGLTWRLQCMNCPGSWLWLAHSDGHRFRNNDRLLRQCRDCQEEDKTLQWRLHVVLSKGKAQKSKGKDKDKGKGESPTPKTTKGAKGSEGKSGKSKVVPLSPGSGPWGAPATPPSPPWRRTCPPKASAQAPVVGPGDRFLVNVRNLGWELERSRSQGNLYWKCSRGQRAPQVDTPPEVLEILREAMLQLPPTSSMGSVQVVMQRETVTSEGVRREMAASSYQRLS